MTQPGRNGWAKFEHDHHRESAERIARRWGLGKRLAKVEDTHEGIGPF
jgi:hypothetical protein